jgi:hypothetical protein
MGMKESKLKVKSQKTNQKSKPLLSGKNTDYVSSQRLALSCVAFLAQLIFSKPPKAKTTVD